MLKSAYIKTLAITIGLVLFAGMGYFAYTYSKNQRTVISEATETPIPETLIPSATPVSTFSPVPSSPTKPVTRLDYVREQLITDGFNLAQVETILTDSRLKLYTIKQVAYKEPDWAVIKQKLYDPAFVQKGKDYIIANQSVFDQAEKGFGVPKEVLAGVIAIETEFGVSTGTTLTFNALYSRMEQ